MRVLSAVLLMALAAPAVARPGGGHKPAPHAARLLGTEFHTKGGTSEIVIHTSREVELEARDEGAAPVFILKHCRALRPNDRRKLDTRFFDSPIATVTVRRHGPDLHVAVALRAPTTVSRHEERGPGDTWYWILSFPPAAGANSTARHTTAANP